MPFARTFPLIGISMLLLLTGCQPAPAPGPNIIVTATLGQLEPPPQATATPIPQIQPAEPQVMAITSTPVLLEEPTPTLAPTFTAIPTQSLYDGPGTEPVERNESWTPILEVFGNAEYALVPVGCFIMGNDTGFFENERPAHQQCFEVPFWIAVTETTNDQYGSNGSYAPPNWPRNVVTWFDAQLYCEEQGGRLPTESEWEYAARGPSNNRYPWGDVWLPGFVIHASNAAGAAAVGTLQGGASWVGALDMAGNLREWTSTAFEPYPYDRFDGREDLSVTAEDDRVVRGGSFQFGQSSLDSSLRQFYDRSFSTGDIGFRCVRDIDTGLDPRQPPQIEVPQP